MNRLFYFTALLFLMSKSLVGQKIVINFDNTPTSNPYISNAPLKYNKDFAYSFTLDDATIDAFLQAQPILQGGYIKETGTTYPGLFYTDGCGNNIRFKCGIAWNTVNVLGQDVHNGNVVDMLTWKHLDSLYNAGWDVFNHSYSHKSRSTSYMTPTDYSDEIIKNQISIREKTALKIETPAFIVPSGDTNYHSIALQLGQKIVFDQSGTLMGVGGFPVDGNINLNNLLIHRQSLEESSYMNLLSKAYSKTYNGTHIWYNEFTHRIDDFNSGGANFYRFKNQMQYIADNWGKNGTDKVWMAPLQEVFEYLVFRQTVRYTTTLVNNKLEINLDMSNVPTWLRRKTITLVVNTSNTFKNVDIPNTIKSSFNGTGAIKIINLDLTDYQPSISNPCVTDTIKPYFTFCPNDIQTTTTGTNAVVNWLMPTAKDDCSTPSVSGSHVSGSSFPIGTTTVTYTAKDAKNNTSTCQFKVNVSSQPVQRDICTNPTANIYSSKGVLYITGIKTASAIIQIFNAQWSNVFNQQISTDSIAIPNLGVGTYNVKVTVLGTGGRWPAVCEANTSVSIDNIVINPCDTDKQAPVISNCPQNISLSTTESAAIATWTVPTATDNCTATPSVSGSHVSGFSFPIGTTTVTYTAKDAKNNTSTCSFTVTVNKIFPIKPDLVVRNISKTSFISQDFNKEPFIVNVGNVGGMTIADSFSIKIFVSEDSLYSSNDSLLARGVYKEGALSVNALADVKVAMTKNAPRLKPGTNYWLIVVSDADNTISEQIETNNVLVQPAQVSYINLRPEKVVLSKTRSGITSNVAANDLVTIGDTLNIRQFHNYIRSAVSEFPSVNYRLYFSKDTLFSSDDYLIETQSKMIDTVLSTYNTSLNTPILKNYPSGLYNIVVEYDFDNRLSESNEWDNRAFTPINWFIDSCWTDTRPPVISNCPQNISLNATELTAVATWTAPTVVDNCTLTPSVSSNYKSGFAFPIGTTTVVYTAKDAKNNTSNCSFKVTVTKTSPMKPDLVVRNISKTYLISQDFSKEPFIVSVGNLGDMAIVDSFNIKIFVSEDSLYSNNDSLLAQGIYNEGFLPINSLIDINVWTVKNAPNLAFGKNYWLIVVTDADNVIDEQIENNNFLFRPAQVSHINLYPDKVILSKTRDGIISNVGMNDLINIGDTLNISQFHNYVRSSLSEFPLVNYRLYFSKDTLFSSDDYLIETKSKTIDTILSNYITYFYTPALKSYPSGVYNIVVEYDYDNHISESSESDNRAFAPINWVTNPCWAETDAPVISNCPKDISLSTTDTTAVATWVTPSVTDNCTSTPSVSSNYKSGFAFPIGTTTVIYTAKDGYDNVSTCRFNVVVTKPVQVSDICIDPNANIKGGVGQIMVSGIVTSSAIIQIFTKDWALVSNEQVSSNKVNIPITAAGSYIVKVTVLGEGGAWPSLCSVLVENIEVSLSSNPCDLDTQAPTFTNCPQNIALTTPDTDATATWAPPTISDNCTSTPTLSSNYSSGALFPIGVTTVTYTGTDARGNSSKCSFTVTITSSKPSRNDLAISITSPSTGYVANSNIIFNIAVTNTGTNPMSRIRIKFPFPAQTVNGGGVTPSVGVWSEYCSSGVLCYEWSIPTLAVKATANLQVSLFVLNSTAPLIATADLIASTPTDNTVSNNSATLSLLLTSSMQQLTTPTHRKPTIFIPVVLQSISPNPTEGDVQIGVESIIEKEVRFDFYNTLGKIVKSEFKAVKKGQNFLNFDFWNVQEGIYFIQTTEGQGRGVPLKFVKL